MTEEIIIDGIDVASCEFFNDYECKLYKQEYWELTDTIFDFCKEHPLCEYKATAILERLEQENKALYEEKNCLHKIIDRLLANAGYSEDIASAEDFEDVYEDMQIKRNELIELEQENKELEYNFLKQQEIALDYWSALEEIREIVISAFAKQRPYKEDFTEIETIINEVLNDSK